MKASSLQKLLDLDRRWIFLFVLLAAIGARLFEFDLPSRPKKIVEDVYEEIERVHEEEGVFLISMDYDPAGKPELEPMSRAVLRHCFDRGVKVVGMTHNPHGQNLGQTILEETAAEYGREYGQDYVYLGYKAGFATLIINMGQDFYNAFPFDFKGVDVRSYDITKNINSLSDFSYVMSITSTSAWEAWMIFGSEKYRFSYGVGATGVMAPDVFPFLQTGQIKGLLGGLVGAAEYETLINHPDRAAVGMRPQSAIHILLMAMIILGNVVFFWERRVRKQARKKETNRR